MDRQGSSSLILNLGRLLTTPLQLRENILLHNSEYISCDFLIDFIDCISYYFGYISFSQFRCSSMPCHFNSFVKPLWSFTIKQPQLRSQFSLVRHLGGEGRGERGRSVFHRANLSAHRSICYRNSTSSKGVMEEPFSGYNTECYEQVKIWS